MTAEKFPSKKTQRYQCKRCYQQSAIAATVKPHFCPVCGKPFEDTEDETALSGSDAQVSLVEGHEPQANAIQFTLGSYQVVKSIGKGGMGEVLLAYDTQCGRRIALKRIRPDLSNIQPIKTRFLKEARVTSQLTHPSIIPIYTIHQEDSTYYTMPYVEGETLKQILRNSRQQEKKGEKPDPNLAAIPALLRIFLTICQAVAYAHSKSVLHRDLKPENIILGKYGEVMILDWGLAKLEHTPTTDEDLPEECAGKSHPMHHITKVGKVVGTLSHMAPERVLGGQASKETDIYSLGVILFQILTLRIPFHRKTLKEFRQVAGKEEVPDPIEVAPYRDIPKVLSAIAKKCLATDPKERYRSVDQLIRDLENYIEGRSEWFPIAELNTETKEDWEFQENILIAEHTAITKHAEMVEWVQMMISKASFSESIRIEADLILKEHSKGIGFLFNIPETMERKELNDGYCLWLGTDGDNPTRLLRNSVEVSTAPDLILRKGTYHHVAIEKVGTTIRCYIDGVLQLTYLSRMPLVGTHVGLLTRDAHYKISPIKVFVGSQNITVSCLSVPDAFLANKDYNTALAEYRRIASVFSGHAEGREAVLRAGITLIEQAKASNEKEPIFHAALSEFEKLHATAGAPLEYLGKALVYEAMGDVEEEAKCFELAFRRYPKHPLLYILYEQLLFRLNESSREDRKATYLFLLLAARYLPQTLKSPANAKLIESLKKHWEPLDFLISTRDPLLEEQELILQLAFWVNKPYLIQELASESSSPEIISNALFALFKLGYGEDLSPLIEKLPESLRIATAPLFLEMRVHHFPVLINSPHSLRLFKALAGKALDLGKEELLLKAIDQVPAPLPEPLIELKIAALLAQGNWKEAGEIIKAMPMESLVKEGLSLYYLYGLWLHAMEGSEIARLHFSALQESRYPPTSLLGPLAYIGYLDPQWEKQAFDYEKEELQRALRLKDQLFSKL